MNNTFVDMDNHKVSVKCLYTQELDKLGENFYGSTKRIHALHVKISDKPEIAKEIDGYIKEQMDNGDYIPINVDEARKKFQLHFVNYNSVVSATSSSTKVRMTTDSSMRSEPGLSLNDVTKPAPGDVPSLCSILLRSRCHNFDAVYDIKKFFRSVLTSDKDSYLQIVCVPATSFSSPPPSNPSWIFYGDRAIPFGDSASRDYTTCAKGATTLAYIQDSPVTLQPAIIQAILEDTYIDDGGVGASSVPDIKLIQAEI